MASTAFSYDTGTDEITVTITGATIGHEYGAGAYDNLSGFEYATAISTTLIIVLTNVGFSGTPFNFAVICADNTTGKMIGTTVFAPAGGEYSFSAEWGYDPSAGSFGELSVTFLSVNAREYKFYAYDWGAFSDSPANVFGTGASLTFTCVFTAAPTLDFIGELAFVGVSSSEDDSTRLFSPGVAGAGSPGNPNGDENVVTEAPTGVETTSATFEAEVNPEGISSTVAFEYGYTTSYGSTTGSQPIGSGSSPVAVTQFVDGLRPGRTYHVRAVRTP